MKSLAPSDREQLMKAFKKVTFKPGATIIKQGDKSDNMVRHASMGPDDQPQTSDRTH